MPIGFSDGSFYQDQLDMTLQTIGDIVPFTPKPRQNLNPEGTSWEELSTRLKALNTQHVLRNSLGSDNVVPIKPVIQPE